MSDKFGGMFGSNEPAQRPAPGVLAVSGFGNTGAVETEEGLVLVDVPVEVQMPGTMRRLRATAPGRVHTLFVTHGHLDHACSLEPLFREAREKGWAPPRVIAQRNVQKRLDKYRLLHGYHDHINRIQFRVPTGTPAFPYPDRNPDVVFDRSLSLCVGGIDFHAFHEMGETDDASWVWVPEKKTVFAGDLVVWSFPNVGNPFKVQRYTLEWAEGLEHILSKEPDVLVPGHGPVLQGRQKIRETLLKVSSVLRFLHREVVDRLNAGMGYEDILHEVQVPPDMTDDGFLAPRYGCPTFVVHGILRQYTGWYDGNPSHLFPPRRAEVAREVAALAGSDRLLARAGTLHGEGRSDLALQLLDMALESGLPGDAAFKGHMLKAEILKGLAERERSFIARNIYHNGHLEELARGEGRKMDRSRTP